MLGLLVLAATNLSDVIGSGNLLYLSAIVGFLLPHGIAIVVQTHWKPGLKSVVAFVICLVAALVTTFAKGDLNFHDYIASAIVVFTLARASYAGLWHPTGVADGIEAATSVSSPVD